MHKKRVSSRLAPRRRQRPKRELLLRPEDFDDVQYNVEIVRVTETDRSAADNTVNTRIELIESAFLLLLGAFLIAGAVLLGLSDAFPPLSRDTLRVLLPMFLLPSAWYLFLHAWEKLVLTPSSSSSSTAVSALPTPSSLSPAPSKSSIHQTSGKVTIF